MMHYRGQRNIDHTQQKMEKLLQRDFVMGNMEQETIRLEQEVSLVKYRNGQIHILNNH